MNIKYVQSRCVLCMHVTHVTSNGSSNTSVKLVRKQLTKGILSKNNRLVSIPISALVSLLRTPHQLMKKLITNYNINMIISDNGSI